MLKRLILALLALLAVSFATPAAATLCNGVTVPTDVASQPGWTCGTTAPQYDTTNSVQNNWLDPAVVPNTQTGLTNIPTPAYGAGRVSSSIVCEYANCSSGSSNPLTTCTSFGRVGGEGGDVSCQETKFRTGVDFSHYGPDDPIRNFGAPGTSHLHCFFGNGATNAYSTYGSLRRRGLTSTAMGTDINATGYWYPCVVVSNYDGAGHTGVVKADHVIVYYAGDGSTVAAAHDAEKSTLLVPGLRYVFGYNMDDGGTPASIDRGMGAWLINGSTGVLDVANAANAAAGGSSSRYAIASPVDNKPISSVDYVCMSATADASVVGSTVSSSRFLAKADGNDPYNGTCESATFSGSVNNNVLTVTSVTGPIQLGQAIAALGGDWQNVKIVSQASGTTGGVGTYNLTGCTACGTQTLTNVVATHTFYIGIAGPQCWDGKRLWTAGGYKHVVPLIYDSKYNNAACPNNYYKIPSLRIEIHFTQYGWADRQRWNLTSDAAARTRLSCNTTVCPPGFTFHTDWMHGWDMVKGAEWMRKCLGAEHNIPHQCAVSQINGTEALGGYTQSSCSPGALGAGGRCPQVDTSSLPRVNSSDSGWGRVPSAWTNSISGMHMHPAQ
jgi:hypothetical protein